MTKPNTTDFFTKELAQAYDERNSRLTPISDNMHFLIRLALKDLPTNSRLLCVGVGTGAEILSLAKHHPQWTFVGVEPSASMLEVCKDRLQQAGVLERCQLINGYVQDVSLDEKFNATLSILVGHFIKQNDRASYYQNMYQRLLPNGYFINTELSYDLNSSEFSFMLKNWEQVQTLMGATPESLANLPTQLRDMLTIISPHDVENLMRESGIPTPVKFFQSFMISGWYAKK